MFSQSGGAVRLCHLVQAARVNPHPPCCQRGAQHPHFFLGLETPGSGKGKRVGKGKKFWSEQTFRTSPIKKSTVHYGRAFWLFAGFHVYFPVEVREKGFISVDYLGSKFSFLIIVHRFDSRKILQSTGWKSPL